MASTSGGGGQLEPNSDSGGPGVTQAGWQIRLPLPLRGSLGNRGQRASSTGQGLLSPHHLAACSPQQGTRPQEAAVHLCGMKDIHSSAPMSPETVLHGAVRVGMYGQRTSLFRVGGYKLQDVHTPQLRPSTKPGQHNYGAKPKRRADAL